eukprot:239698-Chlamydomonas_euryale.AAC.5
MHGTSAFHRHTQQSCFLSRAALTHACMGASTHACMHAHVHARRWGNIAAYTWPRCGITGMAHQGWHRQDAAVALT